MRLYLCVQKRCTWARHRGQGALQRYRPEAAEALMENLLDTSERDSAAAWRGWIRDAVVGNATNAAKISSRERMREWLRMTIDQER